MKYSTLISINLSVNNPKVSYTLAALLSVYCELANKKQAELDTCLAKSREGSTGKVEEKLNVELELIRDKRNKIFDELEKAAGL